VLPSGFDLLSIRLFAYYKVYPAIEIKIAPLIILRRGPVLNFLCRPGCLLK
tara:strand:- start:43556 stop:43708 length:153 start_codon:yes stop_codon:yes gene_type:complete